MSMDTWQNIEITPGVWDWLAERGYSTTRKRSKREDAISIIGPELVEKLEAAELRMLGFEARSESLVADEALVLRGQLGTDSEGWFFNSSGGYKKDGNGRRADVEFLRDGFVSLVLLEDNGRRWVSSARSIGLLLMNQAVELADQWLELGPGGDFVLLEAENVITRSRIIDAGGSGEMVKKFINGGNMQIPTAEFSNPRSAHNVTPSLRALIRKNEGLAPSAPAAPAAPVVSRSRSAPTPRGTGLSMAEIQQAISTGLAPLRADIVALKARNASVTRTAPRRAVAPQVSVNQIRALQGLDPLTVRTVASHAYGGLPTRRPVFSPREVVRRSYGLSLTERSVETRPSVFRSRYQAEAQFTTSQARDFHDASIQQPTGIVSPGTPAKLSYG